MRLSDIIRTCINNLFRHKARTILTIVGVIVGCSSVILMISFGYAMKLQMESFLDEMGDLTVIEVYQKGSKKLDDAAVNELKAIENVASVLPTYRPDDVTLLIQTEDKRYITNYAQIEGMDSNIMKEFGFKAAEGSLPSPNGKNDVILGEYAAYSFTDSMKPEGFNQVDYWSIYEDDGSEPPEPFFDPAEKPIQLVIRSNSDEKVQKEYDLNVVGKFVRDEGKGYITASGFVMDTRTLSNLVQEFKNDNSIPSNGRIVYEGMKVKASDISVVGEVDKNIRKMGFDTYSMESIRESIEKEANQTQLLFAGLGVVSLFVAAIGIMNTMIMAITERTREIGVMKALGCFVGDIRKIFLFEAGAIGLIGGITGSLLSLLLSQIINIVAMKINIKEVGWEQLKETLLHSTERISVIPWQLALGAVGFSILVGVLSGLYPANRAATKISALEAIKTE